MLFDFNDPNPPTKGELLAFWAVAIACCLIVIAGAIDLIWRLVGLIGGAS